jgi:peptidyl-dipeptidase A
MVDYAGGEISAKAMLDYYAPLMGWLEKHNEGKTYTLPLQPE